MTTFRSKFLSWLDKLGRKRVIMDRYENEPYLTRYYLFLKDRKWFPFNVFLHNFHKGDLDDLHDHPWPYFTLILRGGYWEHTVSGKHWRSPGHFRINTPRSLHRIELEPNTDVWTLFIPGPKLREWGFIRKGEWVESQQYLREKYDN
jgi:hypothetical protein